MKPWQYFNLVGWIFLAPHFGAFEGVAIGFVLIAIGFILALIEGRQRQK